MLLNVLRILFLLVILSVWFVSISSPSVSERANPPDFYAIFYSGLGLAAFAFFLDILTPKKSLAALAGVFFGLLVGMFISWALAPVLDMINEVFRIGLSDTAIRAVKWMMGVCICYLVISIVIRTKDDVRFVVPYVEFAKQTKGARPIILDTSAIIDGRIDDLCQNMVFDAPVLIPRFVLNELQFLADSGEKMKRTRGRRGLDVLDRMQKNPDIDVEIDDTKLPEIEEVNGVDQKLIVLVKHHNGRLVTTDYNLTRVANLRQVDVINVNDLANSLKTIAIPGETLQVKIIKPGEEADQGIGYLDDGTMVVVEGARDKIGRELDISITSSIQTSAGKMIFGKPEGFSAPSQNNRKAGSAGRTTDNRRR